MLKINDKGTNTSWCQSVNFQQHSATLIFISCQGLTSGKQNLFQVNKKDSKNTSDVVPVFSLLNLNTYFPPWYMKLADTTQLALTYSKSIIETLKKVKR